MIVKIAKVQYKAKERYFTVVELAEEICAAPSDVCTAIRDGLLPYVRGPDGEALIPTDFVEMWLFSNQIKEARIMRVLTEKELARIIGVSPWTIRKWRLQGGLPHIQVGRRVFYRVEAVDEWMRAMEGASGGFNKNVSAHVSVA